MSRSRVQILVAGVFALGMGVVAPAHSQSQEAIPEVPVTNLKRNVAVFKFELKTSVTGDVGIGMSDMLISQLSRSDNFVVVERAELEDVLNEQGLAQSGAMGAGSAAQMGRLLGVDLAVYGSITFFGEEKQRAGIQALGVSRTRAKVLADVRFVNTSTGEILFAGSFEGTKTSVGVQVDTGDLDFGSVELWGDTRLGQAARECTRKIVTAAARNTRDLPWHGSVLQMAQDGPYCYIKPGSVAGLKAGNVLYVYRKGEELIDPDLGISLGSEETRVGKIQVVDASIGDGKAARCLILEGSAFQPGDLIKVK
jgi:curli biogenesis system outer membrane secretion channel CsgG